MEIKPLLAHLKYIAPSLETAREKLKKSFSMRLLMKRFAPDKGFTPFYLIPKANYVTELVFVNLLNVLNKFGKEHKLIKIKTFRKYMVTQWIVNIKILLE